MKKQELTKKLEELKIRSASIRRSVWMRGVVEVAHMIIEKIETEEIKSEEIETIAKDGAASLKQAVYGGCYLIYNQQIAETFCNKSELIKTKNGLKDPNKSENWLDIQYRALIQAVELLEELCKE